MTAPVTASATTLYLRTFGAARELLGEAHLRLNPSDIPASADGAPLTIADLHRALTARYPALATIGTVRYAANEAFVDDDYAIEPGDDLALIPPVSGG